MLSLLEVLSVALGLHATLSISLPLLPFFTSLAVRYLSRIRAKRSRPAVSDDQPRQPPNNPAERKPADGATEVATHHA
jgi:hypothetical protein